MQNSSDHKSALPGGKRQWQHQPKVAMGVRRHKTRSRFYTLPLVLILLASGCMVGPFFHRPKVEVSPNWLDADDQRVKTGPSEYSNWWKAFNDPVLDRLSSGPTGRTSPSGLPASGCWKPEPS